MSKKTRRTVAFVAPRRGTAGLGTHLKAHFRNPCGGWTKKDLREHVAVAMKNASDKQLLKFLYRVGYIELDP